VSRSAKLAGAAAFGGLLVAIAIRAAMLPPAPPRALDDTAAKTTAPPSKASLQRCRTITEPEPGCDVAWDAERRRFFRTQDRQP
jgi:conjugative transfer region protein TrbK